MNVTKYSMSLNGSFDFDFHVVEQPSEMWMWRQISSSSLGAYAPLQHTDAAMKPWWVALYDWRFWAVSLAVVFAAYQKHYLPNPVARVVGRASFYPTWPFTYISRRNDYWTLMASHVMLGAAPMSFMGHVRDLHARGVRAVVNLCDEYTGPTDDYRKLNITQLRLPTIDHTEPSVEDLRTAVAFIEEKVASGVRVYVHCKSGNGRSAAVVFAWLLHARKFTLEEAQEYMNEKRRVRKKLYLQPHLVEFSKQLQQESRGPSTPSN
jgi:atypical dual specificity phosphatase